MPVYNGEEYLSGAIESILGQTFPDFEFLVIDDGSTDSSRKIILSYKDPRIRLVRNRRNIGLTRSLNRGLRLARGEYIARMDADDVSLPHRLERQVNFMDGNPGTGICGSWIRVIGDGSGEIWRAPAEHGTIASTLLFNPALFHPTVIFRRDLLEMYALRYDEKLKYAQDYALWVESSKHFALANLEEVLLWYRIHPGKIGAAHLRGQLADADRVRLAQLSGLGITPTREEFEVHGSVSRGDCEATREFTDLAERWLIRLCRANRERGRFPEPAFSQLVSKKWFTLCSRASRLGPWAFFRYRRSPLRRHSPQTAYKMLKFAVRCLPGAVRRGAMRR